MTMLLVSAPPRSAKRLNGVKNWILVGGPPCQAYSSSGDRETKVFRTTGRGRWPSLLYEWYLKSCRARPPVFLMENVPGILSSRLNGELIFRKF